MGKLTHGTVGKRAQKPEEQERRKKEGIGTCGTPWNLMEPYGRKSRGRMGVMMSHGIPWKEVEGERTRSVGTLEPHGRCWNLLHSLE